MIRLLIYFCFYSVFGWIIDTAYRSYAARRYTRGGFSRYPFSPIYGFAALFVLALAPYVRHWPIWIEALFFALFLGAYEYAGGVVSVKLFKRRLWNYSKDKWDIHGHTGPGYALTWGLLAVFIIYILHPFLASLVEALF